VGHKLSGLTPITVTVCPLRTFGEDSTLNAIPGMLHLYLLMAIETIYGSLYCCNQSALFFKMNALITTAILSV